MAKRKMIYLFSAIAITSMGYFGWTMTARGAYESAEYTVLESDGAFEIRQYPDLMMATTQMQFDSQGDDGSFMRLFRYISGGNENKQKVAMTTPVFMGTDQDDIAGQMGFVMPKEVAEQGAPAPNNASVEIQTRAGGKFAVFRFPGRTNKPGVVAAAEEKLRSWMQRRGVEASGESELAGYDPPWTPAPLRRNEVLIRCE